MQNPKLCKELLKRILPDLKIGHIEYPELQKEIKPDADAKSIRLDVYVKDNENVVYNVEMQASDTKELPKRSRYYQNLIAVLLSLSAWKTFLDMGGTFIHLKTSVKKIPGFPWEMKLQKFF